jgi:hypothetical protein
MGPAVVLLGAWLVILMGFLGIVALVGFYDTLRLAGPVMILAPILGAVGLTLVTVSHLIPIAMGYELVPAYLDADAGGTGHAGGHGRHLRGHRPGDQRCWQLPRLRRGRSAVRGGHPYHPRAAAVDRMAWPAGRGARWLVGAAQPGIVGDLDYLQHWVHRLLRLHAEHGHRPASAPLTNRRSNPGISASTELTKGRIDPRRDS